MCIRDRFYSIFLLYARQKCTRDTSFYAVPLVSVFIDEMYGLFAVSYPYFALAEATLEYFV